MLKAFSVATHTYNKKYSQTIHYSLRNCYHPMCGQQAKPGLTGMGIRLCPSLWPYIHKQTGPCHAPPSCVSARARQRPSTHTKRPPLPTIPGTCIYVVSYCFLENFEKLIETHRAPSQPGIRIVLLLVLVLRVIYVVAGKHSGSTSEQSRGSKPGHASRRTL